MIKNKPIFHAHEYRPEQYGRDWRTDARNLTLHEFDIYKSFFLNIDDAILKRQRERLL